MDLYLTEDGDIAVSPIGDISNSGSSWRDHVQQAYFRVMTEEGDFRHHLGLGASLSRLYGMSNTPETGTFGEQLIISALNREARFVGMSIDVKSVPVSPHTIRFDVAIGAGSMERIRLSIEQDLIIESAPPTQTGLTVEPASITMEVEQIRQVLVNAEFDNGSSSDVTEQVEWIFADNGGNEQSTSDIITISPQGSIHALQLGTVIATASYQNEEATLEVEVMDVVLENNYSTLSTAFPTYEDLSNSFDTYQDMEDWDPNQ